MSRAAAFSPGPMSRTDWAKRAAASGPPWRRGKGVLKSSSIASPRPRASLSTVARLGFRALPSIIGEEARADPGLARQFLQGEPRPLALLAYARPDEGVNVLFHGGPL